jgi:AAA family ATP:ADP antiporter
MPWRLLLRSDELIPATLLAVYLFISVASTVVAKAARDAIFLSQHTPLAMTAVDILTMVAVACVLAAHVRLKAQVSTKQLFIWSSPCFAVSDAVLWSAVSGNRAGWVSVVAYIWTGVQGGFVVSQASVLAYQVLSLRQAKRFCGLIGTGAMLGSIAGGLVTRTVAARFGAAPLFLAAGALLCTGPMIVFALWKARSADLMCAADPEVTEHATLTRSARAIWGSRHLRVVAALCFLSSVVTTIAGLQFKAVASQSIVSSDQLATFFGSFNLHTSCLALMAQLLLTSRILRGLGVGPALVVAPAALALGSVGILVSGSLVSAVVLRGSDQVLRYSVDRAAVEFLYRPLSAREVYEAKTFIDAFVCRLGEATGCAFALVGAILLRLSFSLLSVISLAFVSAWMLSVTLASRYYRSRLLERVRRCQAVLPRDTGTARARARRLISDIDHGNLLQSGSARRLELLRAAMHSPRRPVSGSGRRSLRLALATEVVGLAVLADRHSRARDRSGDDDPERRHAIERIACLLSLLEPDRFPQCVVDALGSNDPARIDTAVEYLDITLRAPYRQILIPLLERWPALAD